MAGRILDPNGEVANASASFWFRTLDRYGIPGFLCLAFAYLLYYSVPTAIAKVSNDVAASREEHAQQSRYLRDQSRYLYGICVILAKDNKTQERLCPPPTTER